ncbi:ATP-binding cassette domain-containing protein [Bradyrhizobium sp. CSA207]|uniref:branched-chain amino acid ABC transporter ATP-binding protein/permease n=1 Tax=Bradyrhizobium sp. CSA207 TaxID=2698826 RepID=UPI0023AF17A5|nr:ATP-binding cassette domain-containing protein [Bradyrhizobium sp. CSA207]MDE5444342.1 ATP-binding cassette domain-containing protein [Bradyrhizobium sp. CSA207]
MSKTSGWSGVGVRQAPVLGILAAFAAIPAMSQDAYVLGVWTFLLLNILVVIGLDLLLGYAGQLSLGHGIFVAIGAYASGLLTTKAGWSGWAAMPVGTIAASLLAAAVAVPTLRLRGYYLALATLGFPVLFDAMIRVTSQWSGGSSGVISIPRLRLGGYILRDPLVYYYLVLGVVAVVLIVLWNLAGSRLGLKLRAIHADETAASARGINVVFLKASVFVASAAIAALSGSLYVHNVQFVAPDTFGLNYSLILVIMLVVGGMGRIWGGILGVVLLGWMPELLREAATWQPVIFGSILATIMLFAPNGLAGVVRRRSFFAPVTRKVPNTTFHRDERVLTVNEIEKAFGGVQAVTGLSFHVDAGEIKSIIGPNGAGKSTALALISGAIATDGGTIKLCGQSVETAPAFKRAQLGLGRTFQHARLIPTLTVYENILLGASVLGSATQRDEHQASHVLQQVGLEHVAQHYPDQTNQYERRLTEIGTAFAGNPRLLLLDEPGAGLSSADIEQLASLLRELKANGRAIVLVDHIMSLVLPLSDSVLVLNSGMPIIDSDPKTVISDPKVRLAYLGESGDVHA